MFIARQRNHGVRILVALAIVLSHLAVLSAMLRFPGPAPSVASKAVLSELILIDASGIPPRPELHFKRAAGLSTIVITPDLAAPADLDFEPPATGNWAEQGEHAAAGVAAADGASVRAFGSLPHSPPGPRKSRPFGWDKTHTQRVEALPGGRISVRLSDRCGLVLAPLPIGGCSLGKIEARGDLFDEMQAPVEMGDWQDSPAATHR